MSIFNNREDFPYTDYHYFNLDYIVKKMNDLIEYVRTKTGIPKETADKYYIPKCDGEDEETGNIKVNIGMDKDNTDNCNYMLRPYSSTTSEIDRGIVGMDGSESSSTSPVIFLKSSILTGVKAWFDSIAHRLNIQGAGTDYDEIKVNGLSNHYVKISGVANPTDGDNAVNLNYLEGNYTDTEGLNLTINNAMNDVPMYRTLETDSCALSKGEIRTMIDESIPSVEGLMSTTYVLNDEQYLHPRYVTGNNYFAMRWRVGLGSEPVATDGYIGFVPSSGTSFGACVMSSTADGTGYGFAWHNDGENAYIENKLTPTTEGVYKYPTEFRLGWSGHPMKIRGCDTPTGDNDCANKSYVDAQIQLLESRIRDMIANR